MDVLHVQPKFPQDSELNGHIKDLISLILRDVSTAWGSSGPAHLACSGVFSVPPGSTSFTNIY